MNDTRHERGAIAWMTKNSVAANLGMIVLVVGGLIMSQQVKQEVFPEYEMDLVSISVPYPGASPEEVETGIILAIEEQVRGLDGVKRVTAVAAEGRASLSVELTSGANANKALQDIKNGVDRITSFPRDAERPVVSLVTNRREVISLILHGQVEESVLRTLAERVRDEILQMEGITNVDLMGVRPLEIAIEVPQRHLRAHNLTLGEVATIVERTAVELPAGGVKTDGGEILLRTAERRDFGREFSDITVISRPDGSRVNLGEIATITDGFRDTDVAGFYNGERAIRVSVSRVGDQKPIEIAGIIKAYVGELEERLPATIGVSTWVDASEIYADRIDLLERNSLLGLTLVFIILGLFLEIRLAFWVMLGIPISVLGSFLLFPAFDVSINMISLFAFLVALGIVVDDAIVVGENIYEKRQEGHDFLKASILGAKEVAVPVTFSILTNIAAFSPMLFVPGFSGKLFSVIPIIVISVFIISLIESLFILPAHLAHQSESQPGSFRAKLRRGQRRFGRGLQTFIERVYKPQVTLAVRNRYLTLALALGILVLTMGMVAGGKVHFSFMPKLDADEVNATATLTFGSPLEDTLAVARSLEETALELIAENGGDNISRGMLTNVGSLPAGGFGPMGGGPNPEGSHLASVSVFMVPTDLRPITASQFAERWREKMSGFTGIESLKFDYSTGPGSIPINIELSHHNTEVLEQAAAELAEDLGTYSGVIDIDDGFSAGKPQFDFTIKPEARALGLTAVQLGGQLRDAFFGNRAIRQQRGRDEIWVMVRLPESERRSENDIGQLLIRTPGGGEIPLAEAAYIERDRAYTEIKRTDGRRVLNVTADVEAGTANANEVLADVQQTFLPALLESHPGLTYQLEGENRDQRETLSSLAIGFGIAMMVVFALLAIPFRSYFQPLIVMSAIPFGVVGAIGGHMLLGYELSIISMMGIVALSGVVVNDSLMLIHTTNRLIREEGKNAIEAIVQGGCRRFRPILLTSLTTFFGLAPMIFETSVQARFLIPMAISLGFGILFATLIILMLVPSLYIILEDFKSAGRWIKDLYTQPADRKSLISTP